MNTDRIEPHVWRIAAVVVIGAILSILDTTIVNVALDTLSRDLHSPLADIQWVATGYMLALAAVIPVSGWAAGRFGAKRLWIASVVLFTLGSALSGLAWSTETLVIFRVLQGIGGGMIMPVGTMMLTRAAGPARLGRIMSIIGMPMILAPIFGPTLGGLIIDHLDWRWIFYVNVPVGIVAVAMGMRLLPNVEEGVFRTKLDRVGLALLALGVPLFVYGLAEIGQSGGLAAPQAYGPLVVGAVARRRLRGPRAARRRAPAQRAPLPQRVLQRRRGDDLRPRRLPLRRDDHHAAVLPARPRRGRRDDRPAAHPAGHRRRDRDAARRPLQRSRRRRARRARRAWR